MNRDKKVQKFVQQLDGNSAAKKAFCVLIENMEQLIKTHDLPPKIMADFHQAFADDIYENIAELAPSVETSLFIRFEDVPNGGVFWYNGLQYIKPTDGSYFIRPIGGGAGLHQFRPDVGCIVLKTQPQ